MTEIDQLQYAVFALGDKTYELYNTVGIYMDKVFDDLNGVRVYPIGLGDNQSYLTEEHFDQWKQGLWKGICEHYEMMNPKRGQYKQKQEVKQEGLALSIQLLDSDTIIPEDPSVNYEMAARQHLISKRVNITSIKQLRQDTGEGSTLEALFDLCDKDGKQLVDYTTA